MFLKKWGFAVSLENNHSRPRTSWDSVMAEQSIRVDRRILSEGREFTEGSGEASLERNTCWALPFWFLGSGICYPWPLDECQTSSQWLNTEWVHSSTDGKSDQKLTDPWWPLSQEPGLSTGTCIGKSHGISLRFDCYPGPSWSHVSWHRLLKCWNNKTI